VTEPLDLEAIEARAEWIESEEDLVRLAADVPQLVARVRAQEELITELRVGLFELIEEASPISHTLPSPDLAIACDRARSLLAANAGEKR
jgi:hypothetical protein